MPHIVLNFDDLATTSLRKDALSIAEAGLAAINTRQAIRRKMRIENDDLLIDGKRFPLSGRRVLFVGIGKCAMAAACAVEKLLDGRLAGGIAFDVSDIDSGDLQKIEAYVGTHPEPSDVNMAATKRIVQFLGESRESDLVIMLISGGGSTLLCLHDEPMTCLDERMLFDELTARGASIQDLNTVRKHISQARGGGLAKAAYPAEVVSLIVSDVPGNDLHFIASGPTVRDDSTAEDAKAILKKYGVEAPKGTIFLETPKDGKFFERVTNMLFVTNRDALDAMADEARMRGYAPHIESDHYAGEARDVAHQALESLHAAGARSAILWAGESTVSLGEHAGTGGRNQELALAALSDVQSGELLLAFASDGRDDTDHDGAIADTTTLEHAKTAGEEPKKHLAAHSSYDFFSATGDYLETGYTGSNVSDLLITLKG